MNADNNRMPLTSADLKYFSVPLPEDIKREVDAGELSTAKKKIEYCLRNEELSRAAARRLMLESERLKHIEERYTVYPEDAPEIMASCGIKDFTPEELEELMLKGIVDWRYVDKEVRLIDSFAGSLIKVYPEYGERAEEEDEAEDAEDPVDRLIESVRDGETMSAHIHIRHNLIPGDSSIREGDILTAHLPAPKEGLNEQLKNVRYIAFSHEPAALCEGDSLQPTVVFREKAHKDMRFFAEYELDHELVYRDLRKADPEAVLKGSIPDEVKCFLEEKQPHISFSPFMRALAEEITGDEKNPLYIARAIYDFVTTKVTYRFAPNYASIENISEYCAVNRKGDCGIQAILFITLLRLCGIPAVWQSGLDAKPGDVGEHDWARFYLPSIGWLYADPSYGGSAARQGKKDRWDFFFGNLDPYRIPLNEDFQEDFCPPKKQMRFDPYDSQEGELEYEDMPVLFDFRREYEDLGISLNG